MPESPEVQALADDLGRRLAGHEIRGVDVLEFRVTKTRARPLESLIGRRVAGVTRRGKLLDFALDDDAHFVVSLGRHGWARYGGAEASVTEAPTGEAEPPPPALIVLEFDDGTTLELTDAGDWISLGGWVVDDPFEVPAVAKQPVAEKRQRRERGSINPDDIIKGAFELAEQVGIDNLSMPLLGKHLGVGVTSIYWYFRKKDDLLNAMTDRALRQYVFATPYVEATDWRETLRNHARTMRKTFIGNPTLCDLILIRSALSPRTARLGVQEVEKAIAVLKKAYERRPADRDVLTALITFNRDKGDMRSAVTYADKLVLLNPRDDQAVSLRDSLLESKSKSRADMPHGNASTTK